MKEVTCPVHYSQLKVGDIFPWTKSPTITKIERDFDLKKIADNYERGIDSPEAIRFECDNNHQYVATTEDITKPLPKMTPRIKYPVIVVKK